MWHGTISDFSTSPAARLARDGNTFFHVHSMSDPDFIRTLFELGPVVRTMHDPRVFCPGTGKFWAKTEQPCPTPMGWHCLVHAYTQRCCNRHPSRVLAAFRNARFEVREASHRYAAIIAHSPYIRDEAILAGIAPDKITLLRYFTTAAQPSPRHEQTHEPRIVFAGRLSRTKGVHHLLQALAIVRSAIPAVHLDLLGDGNHGEEFRMLAHSLDLNPNVTFHGWADREMVDRYLSSAAVVAFPSIYPEAFGLVGLEAMMHGKPVVGYDVGGVTDWLADRVNGILVPRNNISRLAAALIELLTDTAKARHYGTEGWKIALANFSPDTHIDRFLAVYDMALASRTVLE